MRRNTQEKLYRKVNTTTWGVHHNRGADARWERGSKNGMSAKMSHGERRGLDYTPLYRYLLSRVGQNWDDICSDALPRVADEAALYHIVAREEDEKHKVVRCGETSYYSGLYIDEENILRVVDPSCGIESIKPSCACCTFTFNGKTVTRKYDPAETDFFPE